MLSPGAFSSPYSIQRSGSRVSFSGGSSSPSAHAVLRSPLRASSSSRGNGRGRASMTVTVPNRRPPPKVASEVRKELKASEKQRVEIRAELERSIDLLESLTSELETINSKAEEAQELLGQGVEGFFSILAYLHHDLLPGEDRESTWSSLLKVTENHLPWLGREYEVPSTPAATAPFVRAKLATLLRDATPNLLAAKKLEDAQSLAEVEANVEASRRSLFQEYGGTAGFVDLLANPPRKNAYPKRRGRSSSLDLGLPRHYRSNTPRWTSERHQQQFPLVPQVSKAVASSSPRSINTPPFSPAASIARSRASSQEDELSMRKALGILHDMDVGLMAVSSSTSRSKPRVSVGRRRSSIESASYDFGRGADDPVLDGIAAQQGRAVAREIATLPPSPPPPPQTPPEEYETGESPFEEPEALLSRKPQSNGRFAHSHGRPPPPPPPPSTPELQPMQKARTPVSDAEEIKAHRLTSFWDDSSIEQSKATTMARLPPSSAEPQRGTLWSTPFPTQLVNRQHDAQAPSQPSIPYTDALHPAPSISTTSISMVSSPNITSSTSTIANGATPSTPTASLARDASAKLTDNGQRHLMTSSALASPVSRPTAAWHDASSPIPGGLSILRARRSSEQTSMYPTSREGKASTMKALEPSSPRPSVGTPLSEPPAYHALERISDAELRSLASVNLSEDPLQNITFPVFSPKSSPTTSTEEAPTRQVPVRGFKAHPPIIERSPRR